MNHSSVSISEFVLNCEINSQQKSYTTPILTMVYLATLLGNFLVIVVIKINRHLQTPMYICIAILAIIDLLNSTNITPTIIAVLQDVSTVQHGLCLLQTILVLYLEAVESLLLALMACDRYVAVVHPLRYPSLITNKTVLCMILILNIITAIFIFPYMVFVAEFSFCNTNVLNYCFCDYVSMVKIACNQDPKYLNIFVPTTIVFGACPFALILVSYFRIADAALKISSAEGKNKVFNTLTTHLLVVGLFNVPILTSYALTGMGVKLSTEAYSTMIIVGNIVPPMLNPIIYSFRNKKIKGSIQKLFKGTKTHLEM
ncbi:olfactory receptor 1-like [Polypterus senegalus]|nr:olfactory receptor 1-like [Polypterus senegalus]